MFQYKAAVIGDIHKCWDEVDIKFFNQADYDAILIVGDLPGRTHRGLLDVARQLARLTKPAYFIPGNHDGVAVRQLLAELNDHDTARRKHLHRQLDLCEQMEKALGPVAMVGYSRHGLSEQDGGLDLIAARPHSMGGPVFSFAPYLEIRFGVSDFASSRDKIITQIKASSARRLVFLAHNGPTGLGAERESIWGKDFGSTAGDFGDPDLEGALAFAQKEGRQVCAVLAGHMHHRTRGGGQRQTEIVRGQTVYANAARVPRIFKSSAGRARHHLCLRIGNDQTQIATVLVNDHGEVLDA